MYNDCVKLDVYDSVAFCVDEIQICNLLLIECILILEVWIDGLFCKLCLNLLT